MSKYDDLVKKLKEIFQIDRPELDFGVYRILNSRVVEINDYLDNRLKAKVNENLAASGDATIASLHAELKQKEMQYVADGMEPEAVPGVLALRQKIIDYGTGASEHENSVFTHLLTFFSRYYDKGDFISQRRYKGDIYAIPYAGEEVMLYWANKDQYYTKSGENFSNYGFKLDDGRTVSFRLVTADTAKDNRKDNDKERRFALIEPHTRMLVDDESDEYEESLLPVEVVKGELVLRFEYKVMPKGTKQEELVCAAVRTILDNPTVKSQWLDLSKREPTEKNPQRTLLEKCLTNYTTRNSADYFIHKDLGGFLRRELDFYIKNEVMHLDDVQNAEKFADIEKSLRMIQTLRSIALDLITFLAQIEEFQKKLWLKKKFVVSAHYCVTLDRLPESLYPAIAANPKQWEQWESLGMLESVEVDKPDLFSKAEKGSVEYLKTHPYLMVDTALFDAAFKHALLAAVDNLDESLDGLLIHGDNFQALNLLQERYREQVKCVYIDPPYNAQSSEILYKNTYKHSSWLSLIQDRVGVSLPLLEDVFVYVTAIDEVENMRLGQMYFDLFAGCEDACVSIVHNPTGQQGDNFSYTHEFAHFVYPQNMNCIGLEDRDDPLRESKPDIRPLRNVSSGKNHFRQSAANCFYPIFIKEGKIVGFGDVCLDDFHPQNINEKGDNGVINVYPIDPSGAESKWVFARQKVESIRDELTAEYNQKKKTWDIIREKRRFRYKSLWEDKRYSANSWGSVVLNGMFPGNSFTYPKSIYTVRDCPMC
jgi:adenine-specific DNA-methyltransferase